MNKLTALSKLANAYHHLPAEEDNTAYSAKLLLENNFSYIRRSLRIEDLKPVPEGLNAKGPTFF